MDSSSYPSLLSLLHAQARLAADVHRVGAIMDGLLDDVERLFRAATRQDWDVITAVTRRLAKSRPADTNVQVVAAAKLLSRSIRKSRPIGDAPVQLAALLQACRDLQEHRRVAC